jgi:hypothetical protein
MPISIAVMGRLRVVCKRLLLVGGIGRRPQVA